LIVIDEEHESTFKQETAPRYHARDVALERARAEGIPLLLGSATPSLESWYQTSNGDYRLLDLPGRVLGRPLPAVGTIDLRQTSRDRSSSGALSRSLISAMERALTDGGQVILLLNRRGFSTHVQCPACGKAIQCPHCDIALTHHRAAELLICHYCDHRTPSPNACPECQFAGIRFGGLGTQRLEAEVRARFPQERALRMDTDTMQRPGSHERALDLFRNGDVRILLGTQMIAKGLDFPNVTLVGVINADTALHLPDFRAAERTFQLLAQVAGRTGRGERGGRVLIQTFDPDHPAIRAAVMHDFRRFAAQELPARREFGYPPFGQMMRLVIRGAQEQAVREVAAEIAADLNASLADVGELYRVLGPAPAPIAKLRGQFRYHLQVHGPDSVPLRAASRLLRDHIAPRDGVEWIVDIDPISML
jgi:primosomal protein N' (replication factor Y)